MLGLKRGIVELNGNDNDRDAYTNEKGSFIQNILKSNKSLTCKTGIFHWYGYIQPFEERIKLIKEAKYDYLMLWWEDETYPNFIDRSELMKIVSGYDLKLDNIHLPFDDANILWSENKIERQSQTYKIIKWLHECKKSGANTVVMHNTQGNNHNFKYSKGYDSFNDIIKTAENIKIKVAFENTQMFNYTDFILNEFKSDYAGFCYDSSHDFINGQSCGEILSKWKERLFAVHLSDNDGTSDNHWIPGKGHVDWKKIIDIIKQTDCKSFSMETYPFEAEKELPPFEFLIKARENLLTIIKDDK